MRETLEAVIFVLATSASFCLFVLVLALCDWLGRKK
jgi:hypothetical protein